MTAHPHSSITDVEFEQMREDRNQARDIAVTLEQELAAANADNEGMKLALRAIASVVCKPNVSALDLASAAGVLIASQSIWGES